MDKYQVSKNITPVPEGATAAPLILSIKDEVSLLNSDPR